ncbi:MAG: hypothetical protein PWQ72_1334 [Pseudothermotoga sp.]|nr:hypothetical protein [Pseudothermotoga sp.]
MADRNAEREVLGMSKDLLKSQWGKVNDLLTDQKLGKPQPSFEEPFDNNMVILELEKPENLKFGNISFREVVEKRSSKRKYSKDPLSIDELSYLLWLTQGIRKITNGITFRTVPSAGARHPFETYIFIFNVLNLNAGLYRYIASQHKLLLIDEGDFRELLNDACLGQNFVAQSAAVFVWSCVPYRTVWRYADLSYKAILLDAGHLCQNLYLACESINCGCCAIAAYDQEKLDKLLHVDGEKQFSVYLATVGKIP